MAALVKFGRAAAKLSNKSSLGAVVSVRNHWNKDMKPGPYPRTQEEREAAAKKYNLPIEQYEPYPDDGLGYGDYPKLKDENDDQRDPYYPYDYPELKRNFNEPLHAEWDMYSEVRLSTERTRYTMTQMYLSFFAFMGFFTGIYWWFRDKKLHRPVLPKQYPNQGKTHYTFET